MQFINRYYVIFIEVTIAAIHFYKVYFPKIYTYYLYWILSLLFFYKDGFGII